MEKEWLKLRDMKRKFIRSGIFIEVKRKINWFLLVVREIFGIDFYFIIFGYMYVWIYMG